MLHTAEAVAIGHPDKVYDQIADALLDHCLAEDPHTRSAIEVMGGHGKLYILGEVTTGALLPTEKVIELARDVYRSCGFDDELDVSVSLVQQSPEIARGVDEEGAGDQGIMVGYASADTPERLLLEVVLARRLADAMGARDGKAQVTVEEGRVASFLTSVCGRYTPQFETAVGEIISPHLQPSVLLEDVWTRNPNGPWEVGGFAADTGLTGRKLVVDAY